MLKLQHFFLGKKENKIHWVLRINDLKKVPSFVLYACLILKDSVWLVQCADFGISFKLQRGYTK